MRFFRLCCGDEGDVATESRGVVIESGVVMLDKNDETVRMRIEMAEFRDKVVFKNIDERIVHDARWHRIGGVEETIISIPKSCLQEVWTKLKTTPNTGITATGDVKTDYGILLLERGLKHEKALKAIHDAEYQKKMELRPAM